MKKEEIEQSNSFDRYGVRALIQHYIHEFDHKREVGLNFENRGKKKSDCPPKVHVKYKRKKKSHKRRKP